MKTVKWTTMAMAVAAAFALGACGGNSGKDKCSTDTDCNDGFACNKQENASVGKCMKVSGRGDNQGSFLCSKEDPCPAGQFCWNGICALGCMSDNDCASNQYCDTLGSQLCVNRQVSSCSQDTDCAENQVCLMGMCTADAEPKQCTPRVDGQDGCDEYSICLDISEDPEKEQNACVTFPPCPQDGNCPVGQVGSVCNQDDIPNKERICLTGLCKAAANCPTSWKCVMLSATLGACSDGSMGMPCKTASDCQANFTCTQAMPGGIGFCMPGGTGGCESSGGECVDPMSGCPSGKSMTGDACSDFTKICCK
ncbi:MAG: hypothetical protein GYA21_19485 [Myxococcales bacterium]|nr:hypothetical protein [Myxococcales bacterium]